jgi:hypothetical protein
MPVESTPHWDVAAPLQLQVVSLAPAVPSSSPPPLPPPQQQQQQQWRQQQWQQQQWQRLSDHGGGHAQRVAIQLQMDESQLHAVLPHIGSIQASSSAELTTHAVAPGVFSLSITGAAPAVDAAGQLINSVVLNLLPA